MVADHHFICQDSFDHMLKFDMTTLPDVAEDYARRRSGGDANRGGGDDTSAHDDDTGAREKCVEEVEMYNVYPGAYDAYVCLRSDLHAGCRATL